MSVIFFDTGSRESYLGKPGGFRLVLAREQTPDAESGLALPHYHKHPTGMNTALYHNDFEDLGIPARVASRTLKSIPMTDGSGGDIQAFEMPYQSEYSPASKQLPELRYPVLEVDHMVVPRSLMRRIENELKHDECDARTVFSSCRGLARGSREFEDAYITARVRSFAKHQRISKDPLLGNQAFTGSLPLTPCRKGKGGELSLPSHPLAVMRLGHLMSHLGIWVIALLATQVWAAWRLGSLASGYLEGGQFFYFIFGLFLMLALDSAVWLRHRGKLFDAFLIPGTLLFLLAVLPILVLHVRQSLLAMG